MKSPNPHSEEVPVNARYVVPAHARATLFDALVSAVWEDGVITLDELAATRAAARELGLPDATLSRDVQRTSLVEGGAALSQEERELVVAATAWILAVDGLSPLADAPALVRVAGALGVDSERRRELASVAWGLRLSARHATSLADEFSKLLVAVARVRATS